MLNTKLLTAITNGYCEAAYFTDSPESVSDWELTRTFTANARTECRTFLLAALISGVQCDRLGASLEQVGHDFWLTRQGHGAGFWDRPRDMYSKDEANVLTALSRRMGNYHGEVGEGFADELTDNLT